MLKLKKKDKVKILSGKDKGKTGEILKIFPIQQKAIVSKANIVKKHTRAMADRPGGIIEQEMPLPISKLQLICPKCNKPTKVKIDYLEDKTKVRVCKKCKEVLI